MTAQVLEDKLRALEHYLKEYQEHRRLAVRSSPSSRHRMLHSGGYPDDPARGDPPAKRQKLAEAAKLEDQRYCIPPIIFGEISALFLLWMEESMMLSQTLQRMLQTKQCRGARLQRVFLGACMRREGLSRCLGQASGACAGIVWDTV